MPSELLFCYKLKLRARPKITLHFKRRSILPDCVTKTYKYLDIPTFSRLARQAPQHLKLPIYFWANHIDHPEVRVMERQAIKGWLFFTP